MAYELKTKVNDAKVADFLNTVEDGQKREDCFAMVDIMSEISGEEPKMWGASIVGFGSYHYKYASGHEGDMCIIGFSPRKANITVYGMGYVVNEMNALESIGKKVKSGKGCIYINKMSDINIDTFKKLMATSIVEMKKRMPGA